MNWKRWAPWIMLPIVCVSSGLAGVLINLAQPTLPPLVLGLPLGVFTATLAAMIGMSLLAHINEQARDARFRFDRIYQPLYDDVLRAITDFENCHLVQLSKWREIRETHLNEFIASEVRDTVDKLRQQLEVYNRIWNAAHEAAMQILHAAVRAAGIATDPNTVLGEIQYAEYRFLFDPAVDRIADHRLANLANRFGSDPPRRMWQQSSSKTQRPNS